MNYQVESACYSTLEAAVQASASKVVGSIVQLGGVPHVVAVQSVSGQTVTYSYTPAQPGPVVSGSFTYTPQPCGLLQSADALVLGWGVAAAWIGAYAVMFIAHAIKGETGGSYGNS